jgi:hypothetical protein
MYNRLLAIKNYRDGLINHRNKIDHDFMINFLYKLNLPNKFETLKQQLITEDIYIPLFCKDKDSDPMLSQYRILFTKSRNTTKHSLNYGFKYICKFLMNDKEILNTAIELNESNYAEAQQVIRFLSNILPVYFEEFIKTLDNLNDANLKITPKELMFSPNSLEDITRSIARNAGTAYDSFCNVIYTAASDIKQHQYSIAFKKEMPTNKIITCYFLASNNETKKERYLKSVILDKKDCQAIMTCLPYFAKLLPSYLENLAQTLGIQAQIVP